MTVVFFDCFSGAAGDMILAALLDAGAARNVVERNLEALDLPGWKLEVRETTSGELRALQANVTLTQDEPQRSYRDVREIIESAALDPAVAARALDVFSLLARAEARVHGTAIEDVHWHEIGATDALIDVVGSCAALQHFEATFIAAGPIATGTGTVVTHHGSLPLPAPAVAELLKDAPIFGRGREELVTPTGAALLRSFCDSFGEIPAMTLTSIGYGAGTRSRPAPNVVRVLIGEQVVELEEQRALMLETNIDDLSPELIPHVIERLLESGAQDVWTTPILMKKARHGTTLSVLCDVTARDKLMDVIFSETTTLGLRIVPIAKRALKRDWLPVDVLGHTVRVKLGYHNDAMATLAPEYEDARFVARATGLPLKEIYARATEAARIAISSSP